MNATMSFLKIWLLSVSFEKFTSLNHKSNQSQPSYWSTVIDVSQMAAIGEFLKVNGQQPNFQE